MKGRSTIALLTLVLIAIGLGAVIYKHIFLDFPLLPKQTEIVWTIEAKVEFMADSKPVTVKLALPNGNPKRRVVNIHQVSDGYEYKITRYNGVNVQQWEAAAPEGKQLLYLRYQTYQTHASFSRAQQPGELSKPLFEGAEKNAAMKIASQLNALDQSPVQIADHLLNQLNVKSKDPNIQFFMEEKSKLTPRLNLAVDLLSMAKIHARVVKGIYLTAEKRGQRAHSFLEVYDYEHWALYDPKEKTVIDRTDVLLLQQGLQALLEVYGGSDSQVEFSTQKQRRQAFQTALEAKESTLLDLSIYSLPLADQNTFKLLLMIPIGAFVVVILRNLVGLRTSGTFMPILLALAFIQTELLPGVILFLIVVSFGLMLRSVLSRLNLLLVPRISAVVVFIIIIYAVIGILSVKLGLDWGLRVTYFPMIILSWTVERMSILWEEEGPHEVLIQGGGSLITAIIAFLFMNNDTLASIIFMYPELLLVVLATIIAIGSYSGYRLSDLRRFEPIERLD